MKRIMAVLAACAAVLSLTGCAKKEKIVGTWKIDWILVQPEQNGESDYADRETNASLFESEQSYYKFNQDGVIFNIHEYFQNCLKTGKPIRTPLDEGIKVLKLSTLALESSRDHKEIILSERM